MIHIKQTEIVLITNATTIWTYLWMCLMMMDPCTDLMASGSWILTDCVVVAADLCLQPARTIVPGVSYDISYQF